MRGKEEMGKEKHKVKTIHDNCKVQLVNKRVGVVQMIKRVISIVRDKYNS